MQLSNGFSTSRFDFRLGQSLSIVLATLLLLGNLCGTPYIPENPSNSSLATKPPAKTITATLNPDEDDEMSITGYRRSVFRTAICWICFVLTGGLLRLFMHWWRHWLLLATHTPCPLDEAEMVLVQEHFEGKHTVHYVKRVTTLNAEMMK